MSFQYPDHPNKNRIDPTRDESVQNPFAEQSAEQNPTPPAENPYAASLVDDPVPYQPRDFQTTYGHRGGLILTFGVLGLLTWSLAAIGLVASAFARQSVAESLGVFCAAVMLFGLPLSWSAWLMGRHDLAAMEANAMSTKGRRSTRIGCRTGVCGTVGGAGALSILIVLTLISLFEGG